jgi:SAM-dependent methyltransferase
VTTVLGRPGNYAMQAATYDTTRGASPTVVRALLGMLGQAEGISLLDVAGGTGNYAAALQMAGFDPVVVDLVPQMLARVASKVGPSRAVAGDSSGLPFAEASFDRVVMVNAIHLFADLPGALAEARRVVRDGPLVLTAYTRENADLFLFEYFGVGDAARRRMPVSEVEALLLAAGFRRVRHEPYRYTDLVDGSTNALHISPEALVDPDHLRNNSFWHRIDEDTRRRGLLALRNDLRSGELQRRVAEHLRAADERGHGAVVAGWP